MKRCFIYARVSTSEQNRGEFTSIENQIETCKHFLALKNGEDWRLVRTITDPGFSGKDLERPGIKELMDEAQQGNVDVVVTYKVDRVSRSLIKFYEFNQLLEKNNVEFASATQSFDTTSSSGRLMLNMLLSFAEYEREIISERTSDKMQANFERGKWSGGLTPYGYEHEPETQDLKVHKHESQGIKLMFENIANGETLAATADLLFKKGFTTKSRLMTRKNGKKVDIGGKRFREDVIYRMIKNPFYAGFIRYKGRLGKHKYEKIIPKHLFDLANEMMKRKPARSKDGIRPSVDRHVHLLKGLIKCQDCGSTMTPVPSGKKDKHGNPYLYYTCTEVNHYREGSKCNVRSMAAREFENTIIQYLKDISKDRVLIHRCIAQANTGSGENLQKLEKEEKRLKKQIGSISADIRQLVEIGKSSKKKTEEIAKKMDELATAREALQSELERIQVDIGVISSKRIDAETAERNLLKFTELIEEGTLQEKKELLHLLIKEIKVSRVNHEKGKAPTEVGAFNCKIRTSWFKIVTSLFAIPSIPVTYDEGTKKFVFTSKWLPEEHPKTSVFRG